MKKPKPKRLKKPMGRPPKFVNGVALVVHVGLDREQADWVTVEWHRRGLQTRVDAIRAILDEARESAITAASVPLSEAMSK